MQTVLKCQSCLTWIHWQSMSACTTDAECFNFAASIDAIDFCIDFTDRQSAHNEPTIM